MTWRSLFTLSLAAVAILELRDNRLFGDGEAYENKIKKA